MQESQRARQSGPRKWERHEVHANGASPRAAAGRKPQIDEPQLGRNLTATLRSRRQKVATADYRIAATGTRAWTTGKPAGDRSITGICALQVSPHPMQLQRVSRPGQQEGKYTVLPDHHYSSDVQEAAANSA